MGTWRPWPYAAKAIVQHEWDTNQLNVWVIFRYPMDQTVKPDHGLWLCEVDDVPKAITVSAWQDEWTILLTVPDVLVPPDRVTLEYDGPSDSLTTTWEKQWEPWGPILSISVPYPLEAILSAINSNTALDVKLFEDLIIDNAADGRAVHIHRNAAEGKNYLKAYVNEYRYAIIEADSVLQFKTGAQAMNSFFGTTCRYHVNLEVESDSYGLKFGAGQDTKIWYDGTNLHINPAVVGSGTVIIDNLPAADPGVAGGLWNDSGTLKISAGP